MSIAPQSKPVTASTDIGAMLDAALRCCQAGELVQAERIYREVLALDADTADAWNMLAAVQQVTGRLDEAWESSRQATRLRPTLPAYWLIHGNIALARHRYADARACFSRAVELEPSFSEAHYRLGLACHWQHRVAEAIAAYENALRNAPDVAEIHFRLADALVQDGRPGDAIRAYESAFARDPSNTLPRTNYLSLLNHLDWSMPPGSGQQEIERHFSRDDVDKNRNVSLALRLLSAGAAFRSALGSAADPRAKFDAGALAAVMGSPLFLHLLRDALIAGPDYELLLTRLRARFLLELGLRDAAPLEFMEALAMQCFNNEYLYAESADESAAVAALISCAGDEISRGNVADPAMQRVIAVVAMYRPPHEIAPVARSVLAGNGLSQGLSRLLRRSVLDPAAERRLRDSIGTDPSIADGVSTSVREMYEEHPYPRWFAIDRARRSRFSEWIAREAPMAAAQAQPADGSAVLVAGCGTGHEACELAIGVSDKRVLAVDLSRASLAYARRMAGELGVENIEFRHGDILGLGKLSDRFAMIYCNGVLHHLRDPQAGLRVLAQLLEPGGLLRVSLYSERARASVTAARAVIRESGIATSTAAIREFRQFILKQGTSSPLAPLRSFIDFYSMSMCRDLMFHVQEHQLRLPQIAAMLRECGLAMLGFTNVPPDRMSAYRRAYPAPADMTDFSKWDAFEAQFTDTFDEMYQFWCQRAASF